MNCWAKTGWEFCDDEAKGVIMHSRTVQALLISTKSIAGAIIWGAAEFIVLQWSRVGSARQLRKRLHLS